MMSVLDLKKVIHFFVSLNFAVRAMHVNDVAINIPTI